MIQLMHDTVALYLWSWCVVWCLTEGYLKCRSMLTFWGPVAQDCFAGAIRIFCGCSCEGLADVWAEHSHSPRHLGAWSERSPVSHTSWAPWDEKAACVVCRPLLRPPRVELPGRRPTCPALMAATLI